jgi:RNA polymerase sigma-70 factor (ECF subfamily)
VTKKQKEEALSDRGIVRRVRAGESRLFELLFRRHRQRVYRVARAIVRDDAEAADIVQEAYLRAYTHLHQFAGRATFSTWLTKIAVHLAWNRARLRGRQREKQAVPAGDGKAAGGEVAIGPDPERQAFGKEVKSILEAAIDALPDRYRAVFMMREVEEMSTAETAECLNLSQDTVKTRLHRARARLRERLYASVGSLGAGAFRFGGSNCQRMWKALFLRVKLSKRVRRRGRSLAPREPERKRRETPRATKLRVERRWASSR